MMEPSLEVVCPDGVVEGDVISVQTPDGESLEVVIPPGVAPGAVFQILVNHEDALPYSSQSLPPGDTALPPVKAEVQPDSRPTLSQDVTIKSGIFEDGSVLELADAAALRSVLHAIYDDEALEGFFDTHCNTFEGYSAGGEQQLKWTILHGDYVRLMEERVEEAVTSSSLHSSDQLYSLLKQVVGRDDRAGAFISRVLSMGDYSLFCSMMASSLAEARAMEQFKKKSLDLQLSMTRLTSEMGMD